MVFTLSARFEQRLRRALEGQDSAALAKSAQALSDFYHQFPGQPTPWNDPSIRPGYLAYFLPLNYIRLSSAWRELARHNLNYREIWDFGSGLGTTQWVLEDQVERADLSLHCIETSAHARQAHLDLNQLGDTRFQPRFERRSQPGRQALAVFSYSFLEMQNDLPDLDAFESLMIVEPSTRECGRQLMEWRAHLQERGYRPLAPCTHANACPLLTESPRDWCHHRISFDAPDWWLEMESHLPMKNRTLTFSYLVLSKAKTQALGYEARLIGDTLVERGKTRQAVCRGPRREFLSWLHRHGEPPVLPHGALLKTVQGCEEKGSELRVPPELWNQMTLAD